MDRSNVSQQSNNLSNIKMINQYYIQTEPNDAVQSETENLSYSINQFEDDNRPVSSQQYGDNKYSK